MYNPKDIQFAGKHDYAKIEPKYAGNSTFSVGVFKWVVNSKGKALKKTKALVRVRGLASEPEKIFAKAEEIAKQLDAANYSGPKNIFAK